MIKSQLQRLKRVLMYHDTSGNIAFYNDDFANGLDLLFKLNISNTKTDLEVLVDNLIDSACCVETAITLNRLGITNIKMTPSEFVVNFKDVQSEENHWTRCYPSYHFYVKHGISTRSTEYWNMPTGNSTPLIERTLRCLFPDSQQFIQITGMDTFNPRGVAIDTKHLCARVAATCSCVDADTLTLYSTALETAALGRAQINKDVLNLLLQTCFNV